MTNSIDTGDQRIALPRDHQFSHQHHSGLAKIGDTGTVLRGSSVLAAMVVGLGWWVQNGVARDTALLRVVVWGDRGGVLPTENTFILNPDNHTVPTKG